MRRYLVVIGLQSENRAINKRAFEKIVTWVQGNQDYYDATIAIARKDLVHDNFERDGMNKNLQVGKGKELYPFRVDQDIEIPGYCPSADLFIPTVQYDVVGISTAADVLATAFVMFSNNINFKVITNMCMDRYGLDKEAIKIMKSYMPTVLK